MQQMAIQMTTLQSQVNANEEKSAAQEARAAEALAATTAQAHASDQRSAQIIADLTAQIHALQSGTTNSDASTRKRTQDGQT